MTISLEGPNPDVFLRVLQELAKARGLRQLVKDAGNYKREVFMDSW